MERNEKDGCATVRGVLGLTSSKPSSYSVRIVSATLFRALTLRSLGQSRRVLAAGSQCTVQKYSRMY